MLHLYLAAVVLSLSAVLLLEAWAPLHPTATPPLRRWARNLTLSALAIAASLATPLALSVLGPTVVTGAPWRADMTSLPLAAQWVLTFLVMEAVLYAFHRLCHRIGWLWRLHAVHHSDNELDATTAHRHHPLENVASTLVTLPVLALLAPPWAAVLSYTLLAVAVSTWSHGNLKLPDGLDRALRWLVVTPAYHRVHHSAHQPQTDSHYATLLPLFDRLLGTASTMPADGGRSLTMGLDPARDAALQSVGQLLVAPFRRAA